MGYVYRHIRLDKNEPFYIGIGSDKYYTRAKNIKARNKIWKSIVSKTEYEIEILFDNLLWEECKKKEKEFIALYGRIDLKTGILANLTDGGDGCKGTKRSEELKKRISESMKGKQNALGASRSEETRLKQSEKMKGKRYALGKTRSEETRKKISETMQRNYDIKWGMIAYEIANGLR